MQLRPMQAGDIEAVTAVEKAAAEFPWPQSQFKNSLGSDHECTVLEVEGVVLGFSIFSKVVDEATLLNIAVYPDIQGKGYGRLLLSSGLQAQQGQGAKQCFLEVRVSNTSAKKLYSSLRFTIVGERKNYYPAKVGREHAYVMCCDLSDNTVAVV
ncbi:ribosomal protein S18-alanine N-acetyltransferase [Oceanicoccus sagamiensis]|uniref:[Ribosomal protein bS18]-alanine N-acetyltransferase n=1 Tax=Oceanicoccus sagamiensis TaxID=716816 RepID=A0A1X9N6L3_9GAMM|nr:ribosomal protein S18-alanine N-acetyltransferase [Oceanicoccus sagamiensis]ARN72804.1 ribosomal-protein-alanine N-acetyltransferase [Oceanicoccus sagamiensis]